MRAFLGAIALVGFTGSASATPLVYEPFNYAVGAPDEVSAADGAGTGWEDVGTVTSPRMTSGTMTYSNLQTTAAGGNNNSATFLGETFTPASGASTLGLGATITSGTVYYSMIFQVTDISGIITTGANGASGSFMAGLRNGTGAFTASDAGAPLLIRAQNIPGTPVTFDANRYELGTSLTQLAADRTFDASTNYGQGDNLFLVLAYTFNPGASDDVARLWVNPEPGTTEAANAAALKVTKVGGTEVTNAQLAAFFIRNNTVEPAVTQFDELRVGQTWEDVTPAAAIPEPASLAAAGLLSAGLLARRRRPQ